MKKNKVGILGVIVFLMFSNVVFGQDDGFIAKPKLAVLPFYSLGIDKISVSTSQGILKQELMKATNSEIISATKSEEIIGEEPCTEVDCAVEAGNQLGADHVVICNLSKLGDKIIVQYMLVEVSTEEILLTDNTTSTSIEDLEMVMKRMALSIAERRPIDKTAEIGAIMDKETEEPRRRQGHKYTGVSFGYLYPLDGYDNDDRSFTLDLRLGTELEHFTVGSLFAARKGFATNVFASYLITKTDFCPYIGGAFGFHWVNHDNPDDYWEKEDDKKEDGFEITLNTGIKAFRTYNFQILMNLDYIFTLNDYDDKAIVFTIGLMR